MIYSDRVESLDIVLKIPIRYSAIEIISKVVTMTVYR